MVTKKETKAVEKKSGAEDKGKVSATTKRVSGIEKEAKPMKKVGEKASKKEKKVLKTAEAKIKALRISPLKLNKLARGIMNLPVEKAMMLLSFSKMRVSKDVKALLNSAMANAENNHGMDIDNLYIHRVDVGKAFVMKRFKPRAKGRADRILKPFSNIRIVLIEKNEE
ncbi:50S ribosomal protein L22 [Pseudomonadota bacterium]